MTSSPRESKYWHFRINDNSEEQLERLKDLDCEWIIIGEIEFDETKHKGNHYHVAIKFKTSISINPALNRILYNKKLIKDLHYYLEPKYTNSTIEQFVNYCIKSGIQFEKGTETLNNNKVKTTNKEDLVENKEAFLKERQYRLQIHDLDWFRENDFKFMGSADFQRQLVWAQKDCNDKLTKLDNYFIYGEPCTGKSSSVDFLYPNCYRKIKNNDKWDSYCNHKLDHKVVYFDEMDDLDTYDLCMGGLEGIKEKCDIYPFNVRQNYGNRQLSIRPTTFIITSNFTPSQIFSQENRYGKKMNNIEIKLQAFNRRFKVMHISEWLKMNDLYFCKFDQRIKKIADIENNIMMNEDCDIRKNKAYMELSGYKVEGTKYFKKKSDKEIFDEILIKELDKMFK